MSIACVLRVVVAVVFNERVQQSKNYIMKTKSNELRTTSESPTSDSTYTTVLKEPHFVWNLISVTLLGRFVGHLRESQYSTDHRCYAIRSLVITRRPPRAQQLSVLLQQQQQ